MFDRIESAARLATQAPMRGDKSGGIVTALAAVLLAWRERRFARGVCRDMLRAHAATASAHPGLRGLALYRRIVAERHGGSVVLADTILERAGQSFSEWPTHRSLNFRDVVHCLAMLEFVAVNPRAHWVHADLKRVVSETIPPAL